MLSVRFAMRGYQSTQDSRAFIIHTLLYHANFHRRWWLCSAISSFIGHNVTNNDVCKQIECQLKSTLNDRSYTCRRQNEHFYSRNKKKKNTASINGNLRRFLAAKDQSRDAWAVTHLRTIMVNIIMMTRHGRAVRGGKCHTPLWPAISYLG